MRSPEDMRCIQIDITNACIHNCSNCTRMCGHHEKPFFMSWETFKRAVDSLEGFEGEIGIMGGEPTLHPQFARFAEYLNSKYEQPKKENYFIAPTKYFMRDRKLEERNLTYTYKEKKGLGQRIKGPALWSSLASNYYKYYEIIQDIFRYQCLNDHITPCYHQPILVSRKDMGIPDKEWEELRDKCWMQNVWSATVTPKGCFFCEVAGALDMLFDGNGGWPIEKDWWKRKPEDFSDQLKWCELCGIALDTRSRNANEGIDDVSEFLMRKLEKVCSPKLRKGQVHLYVKEELPEDKKENRKFEYHDNNMNRVSSYNHSIYSEYFPIVFIQNKSDKLGDIKKFIAFNSGQTKKMIVFVERSLIVPVQEFIACMKSEVEVIVEPLEEIYGQNLNRAHKIIGKLSSNLLLTSGVRLDSDFGEVMKKYVINPGTFHFISSKDLEQCSLVKFENLGKQENFVLYNSSAKALQVAGYDGIAKCHSLKELSELWSESKKIIFENKMLDGRNLVNEIDYKPNCRYVIFGTGTYGDKAFQEISKIGSKVIFYCDSSQSRQGKLMNGIMIHNPHYLMEVRETYDKVVIAALAYNDIRKAILENGLTDNDIVAPIF